MGVKVRAALSIKFTFKRRKDKKRISIMSVWMAELRLGLALAYATRVTLALAG